MSAKIARTRRRRQPPRRAVPGTSPGQLTPPPDALHSIMALFGYGPDEHLELAEADPEGFASGSAAGSGACAQLGSFAPCSGT